MYPLVYHNLGGIESIYAVHTVNNNQNGTGPTAINWHQFDMTGNTIPALPVQEQIFNNGNDGLSRWNPSANVDWQGNLSIGYSTSSTTVNPGIRYAGRLATDPLSQLAQGEAIMTAGTGSQSSTSGRWGRDSAMFVDPADGCSFYYTNEYYTTTSSAGWNTRVGSFRFAPCTDNPVPTPSPMPSATPPPFPTPTPIPTVTPTPTPTPTPSPTPPVSSGPVTVTATAGNLGPTDYTTVQSAFAAVNAGTHQGDVNVWVMADTIETTSAILKESGTGGANYSSLLLLPSGNRNVSGAIAPGSPLIDLNGARNVRIDGYNQLTLTNSTVSTVFGTSTVRFVNGAQHNMLANSTIRGSAGSGGVVQFSTGSPTAGNSNNIVLGNNIGPANTNLPTRCVLSIGSAQANISNIISNNNLFDFFSPTASVTGISIQTGNDNWTISSNRIFQTAPRTFTAPALRYAGITIGALGSFTITYNTIGFGAADGTGTTIITGSSNEFRGLDLPTTSITAATSIQGNIISGINQTTSRNSNANSQSAFIAMILGTSQGIFDVGNLAGNTIGSLDGTSSIVINETSTTASTAPVIGIWDVSFSDDIIANNNIGSVTINSGGTGTVTGFRGILNTGISGRQLL